MTLKTHGTGLAMTALMSLAALCPSAGQAAAPYLVDTGTPLSSGTGAGLVLPLEFGDGVGATFTLTAAAHIGAVEGYIVNWLNASVPNVVNVALISGASPDAPPLFQTSGAVPLTSVDGGWTAFGGLDWAVAAGTYTLTFSGGQGTWFFHMPSGVPKSVSQYWHSSRILGNGWRDAAPLDVGVRVAAAVPEPASATMLALGAMLLWTGLRREAGRRQACRRLPAV